MILRKLREFVERPGEVIVVVAVKDETVLDKQLRITECFTVRVENFRVGRNGEVRHHLVEVVGVVRDCGPWNGVGCVIV